MRTHMSKRSTIKVMKSSNLMKKQQQSAFSYYCIIYVHYFLTPSSIDLTTGWYLHCIHSVFHSAISTNIVAVFFLSFQVFVHQNKSILPFINIHNNSFYKKEPNCNWNNKTTFWKVSFVYSFCSLRQHNSEQFHSK